MMICKMGACTTERMSGRGQTPACIQRHLPGNPLQCWVGGLLYRLSHHPPARCAQCPPGAACTSRWGPQSQIHFQPADLLATLMLVALRIRLLQREAMGSTHDPCLLACQHDQSATSILSGVASLSTATQRESIEQMYASKLLQGLHFQHCRKVLLTAAKALSYPGGHTWTMRMLPPRSTRKRPIFGNSTLHQRSTSFRYTESSERNFSSPPSVTCSSVFSAHVCPPVQSYPVLHVVLVLPRMGCLAEEDWVH